MTSNSQNLPPELYRVVDANINRLKEGIRVIEDIMRYKADNKILASELKSLRHQAQLPELTKLLLQSRDSVNDVLRASTKSEQQRSNVTSIILANFKRAQESARVLEEVCKLHAVQESEKFKTIRYKLYRLEKEIALNLL